MSRLFLLGAWGGSERRSQKPMFFILSGECLCFVLCGSMEELWSLKHEFQV